MTSKHITFSLLMVLTVKKKSYPTTTMPMDSKSFYAHLANDYERSDKARGLIIFIYFFHFDIKKRKLRNFVTPFCWAQRRKLRNSVASIVLLDTPQAFEICFVVDFFFSKNCENRYQRECQARIRPCVRMPAPHVIRLL